MEKQEQRRQAADLVRLLEESDDATEVLEAAMALRELDTDRFKVGKGFVDLDVAAPSDDGLRHAFRVLRTGLGYSNQMEHVRIERKGVLRKAPRIVGERSPVWTATEWHWAKNNWGEVSLGWRSWAFDESGNVYGDSDHSSVAASSFKVGYDQPESPHQDREASTGEGWSCPRGYFVRAGASEELTMYASWVPKPRLLEIADLVRFAELASEPFSRQNYLGNSASGIGLTREQAVVLAGPRDDRTSFGAP